MRIVLHIPHASIRIPDEAFEDYTIPEWMVTRESLVLADQATDLIFPTEVFPSVVFPWSRVFCDVERYRDDDLEPMAAIGMGACYTHGHDLEPIRQLSQERRESILRGFYDPHHTQLRQEIEGLLRGQEKVLLVDCHTYPQHPLPYEQNKTGKRPEICLGTHPFHTPHDLCRETENLFRQYGYEVEYNSPFSGTMIPQGLEENPNLFSIMIEVRRDVAMNRFGTSIVNILRALQLLF